MDNNEIIFSKFLLRYEIQTLFFSSWQKKSNIIKKTFKRIWINFSKNCFLNIIFQVNLKKDFDGNEVYIIDKLIEGIYNYFLSHKLHI